MNIKTFEEFLIEQNIGLSQNAIDKFDNYLENDPNLVDNDVDKYIKIVSRHAKLSVHSNSTNYKDYFLRHQLSEEAVIYFLNLFSKADKLDILNNIMNNNFTINDISYSGNFYTDYCKGWEAEAKSIALKDDKNLSIRKSVAVGKFEVLLKFMLKDVVDTGEKGDVNLDSGEMEVKAIDRSGGHPGGQHQIKDHKEISNYLDKNFFNIEPNNIHYFASGKKEQFNIFNENLIKYIHENGLMQCIKVLSKCMVDAIYYQYNISSIPPALYNSTADYLKTVISKNGTDVYSMINLQGCLQLCAYNTIEQFNHFFMVEIKTGKYICIKNCLSPSSPLYDFINITNIMKFKATTEGGGRHNTVVLELK